MFTSGEDRKLFIRVAEALETIALHLETLASSNREDHYLEACTCSVCLEHRARIK